MVTRKCLQCNKEYKHFPSRIKSKTCSNECRAKYVGKINIGSKHFRWQGGRYKTPDGYIMIQIKDKRNIKGYVGEHVQVMEKKINRMLRKKEVVHHIDGNKENNKISNLQLLPDQSHHVKIHNGWKLRKNKWYKPCGRCKKLKEANLNNFHRRTKNTNLFNSYCKPCKKEYLKERKKYGNS